MSFWTQILAGLFNPAVGARAEQAAQAEKEEQARARRIDLYKLEYEQGGARYQDIYRSLWQNFQYMAVVAGAILTFGKDTLGADGAAFLACLPLLLWYWATFVPLDRYGKQAAARLAQVEQCLNRESGMTGPEAGLRQYTEFIAGYTADDRARHAPIRGLFWSTLIALAVLIGLLAAVAPVRTDMLPWIYGIGPLVVVAIAAYWLWRLAVSIDHRVRVSDAIHVMAALLRIAVLIFLATYALRTAQVRPFAHGMMDAKVTITARDGDIKLDSDLKTLTNLQRRNTALQQQMESLNATVSELKRHLRRE